MNRRMILLLGLLASTVAYAAAVDDTSHKYKPNNGPYGSVVGTVILVSDDAHNAEPVNTSYPLPVTVTSTGTNATRVQGTSADGAAAVGNPVQIGGKDGSGNNQTILTGTDGSVSVTFSSVDPCQSSGTAKSSVSVSASADAELVAISGSTVIYVCGFSLNAAAGTTPGFRLIYGTGAVCATGTVGVTGVYLQAVNGVVNYGIGSTIAKTIAGQALCIDVSGVGADFRGIVTYVQQ